MNQNGRFSRRNCYKTVTQNGLIFRLYKGIACDLSSWIALLCGLAIFCINKRYWLVDLDFCQKPECGTSFL